MNVDKYQIVRELLEIKFEYRIGRARHSYLRKERFVENERLYFSEMPFLKPIYIDGMIEAIKSGSLDGVAEKMENVLETVTIKRYPEIENMKKCLLENGAENALMSGSGPTVFGIFKEENIAKQALFKLKETGLVKNGFVTTLAKETGIMER